MAKNLAKIICTEEDKSMYENPPVALAMAEGTRVPENQMMEVCKHFEGFYADVFLELAKYGEVEEMHVCDNIGDHLIGNVYVKFYSEDDAERCKDSISGKVYGSKMVFPEFSPVTDFREGRCRQYEDGNCLRGGNCNFMHLKILPKQIKKELFKEMYNRHPDYKDAKEIRKREEREWRRGKKKDSRSNSRTRIRKRSRSNERRSKKSKDRHKSKDHKKDKKKKHRSRRSNSREERSRSRTKSRGSRSPKKSSSKPKEETNLMNMSSAERRAMIASWVEQDKQQDDVTN